MAYENDNIAVENLPLIKYEGQEAIENSFNLVTDSLINTIYNVQNISEEKIENDNVTNPSQNLETNCPESAIQHSSNSSLINIAIQVCISFLYIYLFFFCNRLLRALVFPHCFL